MSMSNNIRLLRERSNLTQSEFGKMAGVTDKAVSAWENGLSEPRMGAIQKIADYFGVKNGDIVPIGSTRFPKVWKHCGNFLENQKGTHAAEFLFG